MCKMNCLNEHITDATVSINTMNYIRFEKLSVCFFLITGVKGAKKMREHTSNNVEIQIGNVEPCSLLLCFFFKTVSCSVSIRHQGSLPHQAR